MLYFRLQNHLLRMVDHAGSYTTVVVGQFYYVHFTVFLFLHPEHKLCRKQKMLFLYLLINCSCSSGSLNVSGWKPKAERPNFSCMALKFFHKRSFLWSEVSLIAEILHEVSSHRLRSLKPGNLLILTPALSRVKSMASIAFSTRGRLSQIKPDMRTSWSASHRRTPCNKFKMEQFYFSLWESRE